MELSILWTLSKYFTDSKFVFTFDLISSSVESSVTKKKTLAKISCFLLSCNHFESELRRTPLQQRLMTLLFPDCTLPVNFLLKFSWTSPLLAGNFLYYLLTSAQAYNGGRGKADAQIKPHVKSFKNTLRTELVDGK